MEDFEVFREQRNHPRVTLEHAIEALENADYAELQENGRMRVWGHVQELGRYVRVVLLPDKRMIHNAFIDRDYTRRHRS